MKRKGPENIKIFNHNHDKDPCGILLLSSALATAAYCVFCSCIFSSSFLVGTVGFALILSPLTSLTCCLLLCIGRKSGVFEVSLSIPGFSIACFEQGCYIICTASSRFIVLSKRFVCVLVVEYVVIISKTFNYFLKLKFWVFSKPLT